MDKQEKCAENSKASRPKLWTPMFVAITALSLFAFIVGQGINAGTTVYVSLKGGTATYAGILAGVFSTAAGLTRLLSGPIIDRNGRRMIMALGGAMLLVGTIGPVLTHSMALLVLWRFLQGVGFSAATTAAATAAADVLPIERMGEGIGYSGLGQAIAMSIGPALAMFLVSTDPAENLYLGLSVAAMLTLVLALLCRYEKNPLMLPESATYRRHWEQERDERTGDACTCVGEAEAAGKAAGTASANEGEAADGADRQPGIIARVFEPKALPGTLPMIILSPAFGFNIFFMGLYGTSLGFENAGLFYTVSAISMILVRLKSGSFMDRVLPIKIFTAAILCGIVAFVLLFIAGSGVPGGAAEALFYFAGIPYGVCVGISLPLNQAVAVKNTPIERWGAANALYLLASDIGIGVASVVWGIVNDSFGFTVTICCVLGCIIASYVLAWIVYPESAKRTQA